VCRKRDGYIVASLWANGHQVNRKVHQLVCEAFNGARPEGAITRHLDGDRTNNVPENLAWGTCTENNLDAVTHGTHWAARKAVCKHGHSLAGENLYINATSGNRQCRTCLKRARDDYSARKASA
jgi:hypothetical protein